MNTLTAHRYVIRRKRHVSVVIGCSLILLIIAAAGAAAPWIVPNDPNQIDLMNKFASFSARYPLGTDHLGRCTFSRLLMGIRTSLSISVMAMASTILIGALAGTITALKGGRLDAVFMRICDILLAFPTLVLAFAILGILGPGTGNLILALVLSQWVYYSRMVRSMVLKVKLKLYYQSAKVAGTRRWTLIWRHVLPGISAQLLVLATLEFGSVILEVTGLSFLGLGVQAPTAEWGMMMNEARQHLRQHPELMWLPGMAVTLVVGCSNVLGETLRDYFDPKEQ
ncbi:ABC transporter permease [Paenibacillus hamazuiensis]|uniref:ABC transporter permease n=1 Tax=Paenibacillus hamazuiensis TaxID=2936508 RepID=UPI00200C5092|nr:ABC transporter permease subunit [Paenibacillus hamazuiensis]